MSAAVDLRLTNADIESMPEDGNRYEVIDGELFVSSAPSYVHQMILGRILRLIGNYLDRNPIGSIVAGIGVIFDEYTGVIPDLVFASKERLRKILGGGRFQAAPEIAIEILSPGPSNQRRDRHAKRNLYAARGVEEYWLFDPESRTLEVYRRDPAGELVSQGSLLGDDPLTSPVLPGFSAPVSRFFE